MMFLSDEAEKWMTQSKLQNKVPISNTVILYRLINCICLISLRIMLVDGATSSCNVHIFLDFIIVKEVCQEIEKRKID